MTKQKQACSAGGCLQKPRRTIHHSNKCKKTVTTNLPPQAETQGELYSCEL